MKYIGATKTLWVLGAALLLLCGCTFFLKFEVFNNTDSELHVIQEVDGERKSFNIAPKGSLTLEGWDAYGEAKFTVIAGEKRWNYRPVHIKHRYGEPNFFPYFFPFWLFRRQIEKDGRVFVLEPGKRFPQSRHIAQPEGYPLKPRDGNV